MSTWAIVLAVGKDQEVASGVDISFLGLGDRPVLARSLHEFEACSQVEGVILVVAKSKVESALQMIRTFGFLKVRSLVAGGSGRQASLKKAYDQLPDKATAVVVHEAARPFVQQEVIAETVKAGKRYGAAVAAVKSIDPVKLAEKGQKVSKTLDRNTIWLVQTPQAFKRDVFEKMIKTGSKLMDDESALLAKTRQEIHLVVSSSSNIKIRTAKDLEAASALVNIL